MTVNQVCMHFRKQTVRRELATDDQSFPQQIVVGSAYPNRMQITNRIALDEAIRQLPEGYRKVFELHDIHGYKHSEVAKILGCTEGTSKSQLHKARQRLRELIRLKADPRQNPCLA
jgi:RNA polymerase sigma-70 factor, ECF subfamily